MEGYRVGPLVVTRDRRVYVVSRWRVHHGLFGVGLLLTGAVLVLHDRADWPWRLRP